MKYYLGYENNNGKISLIFKDGKNNKILKEALCFHNQIKGEEIKNKEEYMLFDGITDLLAEIAILKNEDELFKKLNSENVDFNNIFVEVRSILNKSNGTISENKKSLEKIEKFLTKNNIESDKVIASKYVIGMGIGVEVESNCLLDSLRYPLALTLIILINLLKWFKEMEENGKHEILEANAEYNYLMRNNHSVSNIFKDLSLDKYINLFEVKDYVKEKKYLKRFD